MEKNDALNMSYKNMSIHVSDFASQCLWCRKSTITPASYVRGIFGVPAALFPGQLSSRCTREGSHDDLDVPLAVPVAGQN